MYVSILHSAETSQHQLYHDTRKFVKDTSSRVNSQESLQVFAVLANIKDDTRLLCRGGYRRMVNNTFHYFQDKLILSALRLGAGHLRSELQIEL